MCKKVNNNSCINDSAQERDREEPMPYERLNTIFVKINFLSSKIKVCNYYKLIIVANVLCRKVFYITLLIYNKLPRNLTRNKCLHNLFYI